MIVPSIVTLLALSSLVNAKSPRQVIARQAFGDATPDQALAAGTRANAAVGEIIVAIVASAKAAADAIVFNQSVASAASVAATRTIAMPVASDASVVIAVSVAVILPTLIPGSIPAAVVGSASSSSSLSSSSNTTTSTSSTLPSHTGCPAPPPRISGDTNTAYLPNIITAATDTTCQSVCQVMENAITVCSNENSSGSGLAACSCKSSFLLKLARCTACEDSLSTPSLGYGAGNFTSYCQQCISPGFQPEGSCGLLSDNTPCGLNPVPAEYPCQEGYGFEDGACNLCLFASYSDSNRCVSCAPYTQWLPSKTKTCITCNTTSVAQCQYDGNPTKCNTGYSLYSVFPINNKNICLIDCSAGSGRGYDGGACTPCLPGYYNSQLNTCTAVDNLKYSLGNTTTYLNCTYNPLTDGQGGCDSATGDPRYCLSSKFGLTSGFSPNTCIPCLYGAASDYGRNSCICTAPSTASIACYTTPAPVDFDTAIIRVTIDNNGCEEVVGYIQANSDGNGRTFIASTNVANALQFLKPTSIGLGVPTVLKVVTPFILPRSTAGYQYLGIVLTGGSLNIPLSATPMSEIVGFITGSTFVAPGSTLGEDVILDGFGSTNGGNSPYLKGTSDSWIIGQFDVCKGGYPISLEMKIPATLNYDAFTSYNASLYGTQTTFDVAIIGAKAYAALIGQPNNGQLLFTLVPNAANIAK